MVANVTLFISSQKQTESNIRNELTLAGITVESRVYKTDDVVIEILEEFFVSLIIIFSLLCSNYSVSD